MVKLVLLSISVFSLSGYASNIIQSTNFPTIIINACSSNVEGHSTACEALLSKAYYIDESGLEFCTGRYLPQLRAKIGCLAIIFNRVYIKEEIIKCSNRKSWPAALDCLNRSGYLIH